MKGNLEDISKTQENVISNNYFHLIKKDNTKKITCKEKNFINFINSFNSVKVPLYSNYHYSKTVKIKNNISFQNTPIPSEKITYKNIYNNRDLINDINIKKDNYLNTEYNTEERNKDKEKKFFNVKNKTKNNQSYNNLDNFFRNDENKSFSNKLHLIKSEKKLINLKQNFNINKTDLKTIKIPEKSKKIFNLLNTNEENSENLSQEKIENKLNNETFFCKTHNNFFNKNDNKEKNHGRNMKSLINKSNQISKLNIEFSNKSTKIKNIFVKHKTQNKFGIINLKFENINKKNEDSLYFKSNNKILINNDNFINKEKKENNNVINYIYNSNNNNTNNKNYKISSQNKKQNLIINNISQKKIYNLTPSENMLYNNDSNIDKSIINKNNNNNRKLCNNQIIYNDNKNIFIQNNYINGKLHNSKEIFQHDNNQRQIYIKNKSFDNTKQNRQNNYITNLKSLIPIGEHFNNAINNIKNIFLGTNNNVEDKEEEKNKNDINNYKSIDNSNTKEEKSSLVDDSVIFNSSDVYGTLNFSKSFDKKTNEEENQSPKDNGKNKNNSKKEYNKENIAFINSYSNYRETITLNLNLNPKINNNNNNYNNISKKEKEKSYKKIMLSEIITNNNNNNNRDKTPKKEKKYINITNNNKNQNNNKQNNVTPIKSINNNYQNNNIYNYKTFSVISTAGKNFGVKKINQDTPIASVNINDIKGFNIFGVLDGHGTNGHYVSKFLRNYLIEKISKNKEISESKNLEKIYEIIKKLNYAFLINIFLKSDEALYKQNFDVNFSGTTCVLVIQIGKKLICANVGDSRAILVYNNNNTSKIFNLSHDFKPDLPEEKKRINKMGGVVEQMLDMNGMRAGPPRVWGSGKNYPGLAMSRSLGDFKGKKYGIISLPEIIEVNLHENVKYIVICSDGVWEFLSNESVMDIGNEFYEKNDVNGFTKKLAEISEKMWEQKDVIVDDITAVAVFY